MEDKQLSKKALASSKTIRTVNALGLNRGRAKVPVYLIRAITPTSPCLKVVRTLNIISELKKFTESIAGLTVTDVSLLSYESKHSDDSFVASE